MTSFVLICATMLALALAVVIRPLTGGEGGNPRRLAIPVLAIGLPLTASILYSKIGDPEAIRGASIHEKAFGPPAAVMKVIERARTEPENFEAQLEAADFYYQIQRYDDAIAYLNRANRLRPDDAETIIRLGLVNAEAGRLDLAASWFKSGLVKQPDNAVALEAYCLLLIHQGNTRVAAQTLERLERIDPNNPDLPHMRTVLTEDKRNNESK